MATVTDWSEEMNMNPFTTDSRVSTLRHYDKSFTHLLRPDVLEVPSFIQSLLSREVALALLLDASETTKQEHSRDVCTTSLLPFRHPDYSDFHDD